MRNKKKICKKCEELNGRNYYLLQHEDGYKYCPHCGRVSGILIGWQTKEDKPN
jgi:hypothetical protein